MAVALKRKRGTVSYREPSSDEDFSESDSENAPAKKRAVPVRRSARHQSTEAEQSSSRPQRQASPAPHKVTDERRALRRRGRRRVSYRDVSSDDDNDEDFEIEEVLEQRQPRAKRTSSTRLQSKQSRKMTRKAHGSRLRRTLGAPLKPKTASHSTINPAKIPTDGRIPTWTSLPYHVLLQIFVYAAHPLHDENMTPTSSISWLARVARICSAFTKPALTALYRVPPIFAIRQNRKDLVHHLISPPADAHEDHQVMVKRLELDATQMSALTDPTNSVADLAALVAALTTVREIDIFDPLDRPPYREQLKRMRRWQYPDELFSALQESSVRLWSWRWSSFFCTKGLLWMKEIHADQAFQSLRDLTLTKFHTDESRKLDETGPTVEELLGSALAVLPNIRSLAFESCKALNGRLLPLLPTNLLNLNITNCFNLTSDALQAFLAGHGRQIEELVLNHNQSLDLSFLVGLKESCPNLEILRMDLNYYSSLVMSADNEPLYDWLLGLDEIPTWPSTLRVIDMEYLRHWSSTAAINFFTSLIDSAGDLPWLRELRILAMVDIDWRQRADFRRKWAARFERVFARRDVDPSPHLASLRAYRESKASQLEVTNKNDSLLDISDEVNDKEIGIVDDQHGETTGSDSDVPIIPKQKQKQNEKWNTQRLRTRGKASANYEETSESESSSNESSEAKGEPEAIQGRCHTVIFRIDNLRPREELYDEGDFLDEERSGDEEWNGNDAVDDDYAW